jgi:hypothetical protein
MQLLTSPSLLGIPVLSLDATGPEYSRWRRSVKFALETKDTWKYCNGTHPMPMPKAAPAMTTYNEEIDDTQPSLLEERRAWMRRDREVKLDIFLSLSEEVMQDVFEIGPPLPPTRYTSQQMLEALDNRFSVFEFEGYHHAFCHFLNLHVDQHASLDDFNKEFLTVLEDLHDYGHPLSNVQACSAYFSKLRCTQNPWVAKKVAEWDVQPREPQLLELMQESALWPCIKPLASNAAQDCYAKSMSEKRLDDSPELGPNDSDVAPELSETSTLSSKASHSRQTYETTSEPRMNTAIPLHDKHFDPQALCEALERIPAIASSERPSLDEGARTNCTTPEWLNAKDRIDPKPQMQMEPEPVDIPLLFLPPSAFQKPGSKPHTRSLSTPVSTTTPTNPKIPEKSPRRQTTDLSYRKVAVSIQTSQKPPSLSDHPAFRYRTWAPPEDITVDIHPALRPMTPMLQPQKPMLRELSCSPLRLTDSKPITPKRNLNRPRARSVGNFSRSHDSSFLSSSNSNRSSSVSTVLDLPIQGPTTTITTAHSTLAISDAKTTDSPLPPLPPLPPYNPTAPLSPPSPSQQQQEQQQAQKHKATHLLPFSFTRPMHSTHARSSSEPLSLPLPTFTFTTEDNHHTIQPPISVFSLASPSSSSFSFSSSSSLLHKSAEEKQQQQQHKKPRKEVHKRFSSCSRLNDKDKDKDNKHAARWKSDKSRDSARGRNKSQKEKSWALGVAKMSRC